MTTGPINKALEGKCATSKIDKASEEELECATNRIKNALREEFECTTGWIDKALREIKMLTSCRSHSRSVDIAAK